MPIPSEYLRVSDFEELTQADPQDFLVVLDIDDFSESPTGKLKRIKKGLIIPSAGDGETVIEDNLIVIDDPLFFDIQAGILLKEVIVKPSSDTSLSIGNSIGTDDIFQAQDITAIEGWVYLVNRVAWDAPIRIYFTGLPSSSKVYFIIKRLIT